MNKIILLTDPNISNQWICKYIIDEDIFIWRDTDITNSLTKIFKETWEDSKRLSIIDRNNQDN